jgi:hypothetical protein
MENKSIYAQGLFFNRVKPETPDSVKAWKKGSISIDVAKFTAQLEELKDKVNDKGYLYFDLTQNEKNGETFLSFRLNDWKPEKRMTDSEADAIFDGGASQLTKEDVPFN